ncbi:adenylate/guanylate cyclase domain-containing protein [Bradyrhizobium sp. ma5]|uniref:adenylate/guanylate cyclase domain-containing protein n=1 Tax=Bradyrhizobium sp. ma5 TaxID=3344828 RepID=UPI0035D4499A
MTLQQLRDELADEVSTILDSGFSISITQTNTVPHSGDPVITFPNLDTDTQGAKLIETCVLYIDMRRSTDLNLAHRAPTVAKLYSAFVRAMTRTARHYGGHVRGIIGDRVMVLFDVQNCFESAVDCAVAMNTVCRHIINEHFKPNDVRFGIGIDYGRMLATKTGIRRHGVEQPNYQNLVWLGRPANVASKLTDVANKPEESTTVPTVRVAYENRAPAALGGLFGSGLGGALSPFSPAYGILHQPSENALAGILHQPSGSSDWNWKTESLRDFVSQLDVQYGPRVVHKHPDFKSFFLFEETQKTREATPSILMTSAVWLGFKKAKPNSSLIQNALFGKVNVRVPGYNGDVYGGGAIFTNLT